MSRTRRRKDPRPEWYDVDGTQYETGEEHGRDGHWIYKCGCDNCDGRTKRKLYEKWARWEINGWE